MRESPGRLVTVQTDGPIPGGPGSLSVAFLGPGEFALAWDLHFENVYIILIEKGKK